MINIPTYRCFGMSVHWSIDKSTDCWKRSRRSAHHVTSIGASSALTKWFKSCHSYAYALLPVDCNFLYNKEAFCDNLMIDYCSPQQTKMPRTASSCKTPFNAPSSLMGWTHVAVLFPGPLGPLGTRTVSHTAIPSECQVWELRCHQLAWGGDAQKRKGAVLWSVQQLLQSKSQARFSSVVPSSPTRNTWCSFTGNWSLVWLDICKIILSTCAVCIYTCCVCSMGKNGQSEADSMNKVAFSSCCKVPNNPVLQPKYDFCFVFLDGNRVHRTM